MSEVIQLVSLESSERGKRSITKRLATTTAAAQGNLALLAPVIAHILCLSKAICNQYLRAYKVLLECDGEGREWLRTT